MKEWRQVVGYEGIYEVSNHGEVRRDINGEKTMPWTVPGRHLTITPDYRGYNTVKLVKASNIPHGRRTKVHRIVAEAFIGAPPEYKTLINHKDCNKTNNIPENLEWCTNKENLQHAHRAGVFDKHWIMRTRDSLGRFS